MKPLPCLYVGIQTGSGNIPDFRLYTILEEIPGHHPALSTLSEKTIATYGYIPIEQEGDEHVQGEKA